jgi:hypothetical protein
MRPFAAFLCAAGLLALTTLPALAAVPSPPNCLVQNVLIGSWDGGGISTGVSPCGPFHPGLFLVVVRDVANNPIPGATVKVLFSGSGLRPHLAQNAGIATICPAELAFTANANGAATVNLRFAGTTEAPAISIFADGVLLANVPARSPDYDGDGVVGLADFGTFAADYLAPALPHPRSDFDNCPSTTLQDFAFFAAQFIASNGHPPAALCP